jgi:hypothetical protein
MSELTHSQRVRSHNWLWIAMSGTLVCFWSVSLSIHTDVFQNTFFGLGSDWRPGRASFAWDRFAWAVFFIRWLSHGETLISDAIRMGTLHQNQAKSGVKDSVKISMYLAVYQWPDCNRWLPVVGPVTWFGESRHSDHSRDVSCFGSSAADFGDFSLFALH